MRVMRRDGACGCTLVEVLIALGLIVVTFVGLAQLLMVTMARVQASHRLALASWLASSKLEQLQSLTWRVRFVEDFAVLVQDEVTDLRYEPARGGGRGTRESDGEMDYLDTRGQWVGVSEVAGAAFARRWQVHRRGVGPSELLLFEVAVADLAGVGEAIDWQRSPRVVRVHGAKLRRASE